MTAARPLRVAVVGAGPAGIYAAGHLLAGPAGTYVDGRLVDLTDGPVEVDVLERLPTPWGLVRGGVAPDHPDKKLVAELFETIARRPGFRFFGNVEVGRDVQPAELTRWYDAVIYAVGAAGDRALAIPGEALAGCLSAREFVAWYNGHPDYSDLRVDLSCERAVIIGNGNVALDVARILTLDCEALARTDIADHALRALRGSAIREVVILGRRGHLQAAFNTPELEELMRLPGVDLVVDEVPTADDMLDPPGWSVQRKLDVLRDCASSPPARRRKRIVLRFLTSPTALTGTDRVESVLVVRNRLEHGADRRVRVRPTDERSAIPTGLVLRAIGYFGQSVPGLPFDEERGVIPNNGGRVLAGDQPTPGTYVTGWIKRGPSGIIGTNKKCSRDTVRALLADAVAERLPTGNTLDATAAATALSGRQPALVDDAGWRAIDRLERTAGRLTDRPRVKLSTMQELLSHVVLTER